MSQENQISLNIPEADKPEINAAIAVLVQKLLPHLVALTPEQRQNLSKAADKTLAFLELVRNTDGEIEAISKENALERLLAINRAELRYYRDPLIVAFSCCNKEFDIENLLSIERRILSSLIENTEQCLVTAASPHGFAKLIRLM